MASDFNRSNNNYWDTETSENLYGGGYNGTFEAGTNSMAPQGRTSLQMKNFTNYSNWDFSTVWSIDLTNNGYPYLKWQTVEVTPAITTFPWVEAFEEDSPTISQWMQRQISGNIYWYFTGSQGYNESNNCAQLEHDNVFDGSITRLITPPFNLSGLANPRVKFYYKQANWSGDINALKIYYKNDFSDNWTQFFYDNTAKDDWTECILDLPSPSAYYQLAFEGIDNFGWPNVIDDVEFYGEQPSAIDNSLLPFETKLYSNYPNPFNPITTIKFDLKSAGQTKLVVYNAKGELVKTLINGIQSTGSHSVNFDGIGLNSGVYFYKLEADGKSIIKRMLMVK